MSSSTSVSIPITGRSLAMMFDGLKFGNEAIRLDVRFYDKNGNFIGSTNAGASSIVINKDESGNIVEAYIVFNVDGPNREYEYARVHISLNVYARESSWRRLSEDVDIYPPSPSFSLKVWLVKPSS